MFNLFSYIFWVNDGGKLPTVFPERVENGLKIIVVYTKRKQANKVGPVNALSDSLPHCLATGSILQKASSKGLTCFTYAQR